MSRTTHFPGHLRAVVGYLRRYPRVRIAFGEPPHREARARFLYCVRPARGIHTRKESRPCLSP